MAKGGICAFVNVNITRPLNSNIKICLTLKFLYRVQMSIWHSQVLIAEAFLSLLDIFVGKNVRALTSRFLTRHHSKIQISSLVPPTKPFAWLKYTPKHFHKKRTSIRQYTRWLHLSESLWEAFGTFLFQHDWATVHASEVCVVEFWVSRKRWIERGNLWHFCFTDIPTDRQINWTWIGRGILSFRVCSRGKLLEMLIILHSSTRTGLHAHQNTQLNRHELSLLFKIDLMIYDTQMRILVTVSCEWADKMTKPIQHALHWC